MPPLCESLEKICPSSVFFSMSNSAKAIAAACTTTPAAISMARIR